MSNKIRNFAIASAFISGAALAGATAAPAAAPAAAAPAAAPMAAKQATGASAEVTVTAVDTKAGTLTLQMADGSSATLKAEGKAAMNVSHVTVGEKAHAVFRDDDKGQHAAVTHLRRDKEEKTAKADGTKK